MLTTKYKVGDFVYCSGGFDGSYYGRIIEIDNSHVACYKIQSMYYPSGQQRSEERIYWTNEVRNGYDVINDEVQMLQRKIERLKEMEQTERIEDDN